MNRLLSFLAMLAAVLAVQLPAYAQAETFGGTTPLIILGAGVLFIVLCGAVVVNLAQRKPMNPEPR